MFFWFRTSKTIIRGPLEQKARLPVWKQMITLNFTNIDIFEYSTSFHQPLKTRKQFGKIRKIRKLLSFLEQMKTMK